MVGKRTPQLPVQKPTPTVVGKRSTNQAARKKTPKKPTPTAVGKRTPQRPVPKPTPTVVGKRTPQLPGRSPKPTVVGKRTTPPSTQPLTIKSLAAHTAPVSGWRDEYRRRGPGRSGCRSTAVRRRRDRWRRRVATSAATASPTAPCRPEHPADRFALASGSKILTALGILRLIETGALGYDPVRPILGEDLPADRRRRHHRAPAGAHAPASVTTSARTAAGRSRTTSSRSRCTRSPRPPPSCR